MPRPMSSALIAALSGPAPRIFRAVEIYFPSMTLRLWTGRNSRMINGNVYLGVGTILGFSDVTETGNIEATGTQVTLSGLPSELVSVALSEPYQGSVVNLWFGERSVASDMVQIGSGVLDQMLIDDNPETATITITVESILIELQKARGLRYTMEDHKLAYPDDKIFEFVADIQDMEINWL